MRRGLVDYSRSRDTQKPGGGERPVPLDEAMVAGRPQTTDPMALDDALTPLAKLDPRKEKVVELRFYGGLSVKETASVLNVSPFTVIRDWNFAKTWLHREIRA